MSSEKNILKVGITGGIGSGKTTICSVFECLGIPVYYADREAKLLMVRDKKVIAQIQSLLGDAAYLPEGGLNKVYIAEKIFNNDGLLQQMNGIVHPAVRASFEQWTNQQDAPYVLEESAILFEEKLNIHFDKIILVTADESTRMERVLTRPGETRESVQARMNNQWADEQKIELADFVIDNNGVKSFILQCLDIHNELLALSL